MRYLLSMIGDETDWQTLAPEDAHAMIDQVERFNDQLRSSGAWVYAEGLGERASARTVRFGRAGAVTIGDGAFSDAALQSVGFWVIEAGSTDEAVEWAKRAAFGEGATIEVRPLVSE